MHIKTLRHTLLATTAIAVAAVASTSSLAAPVEDAVGQALLNGTTNFDLRTRYEFADIDNGNDSNGNALTARVKLGYTTAKLAGWDAKVEFEGNWAIIDEYNVPFGATPSNPDKDVIPDAEGEEFNETWLRYTNSGFQFKYGRQRIILDKARFVGNVGWRQNEQTYDAGTFQYKTKKAFLFAGYLNNVNDIFFRNFDMDSVLLNAHYQFAPAFKLSAYGYLLDYENNSAAGLFADSSTIGVRAEGKLTNFDYLAEYANYSDYADSDDIDADYIHARLGAKFAGVKVQLGYELLGGADGGNNSFMTPLATLHAYNGWTDQFLVTPNVGLQDLYLSVGGKVGGVKLLAVYHKFDSDDADVDFGDEIDLLAATKMNDQVSLLAKVGVYSQGDDDSGKVDTTRVWLQMQYRFAGK